jgi:putative nucleotidyltransferase-like protein
VSVTRGERRRLSAARAALVALLRGAGGPARAEQWADTVAAARAERLLPWLHRRLRRGELDMPADLRAEVELAAIQVAVRNLALTAELGLILRTLEAARIACAPLRGIALSEALGDDLGARPMGDLDVLVRRGDVERTAGVLASLGYTAVDRRPGFAQEFGNTLELVTQRHGGVVVEPHWSLAYPPFTLSVDAELVWATCVRGTVAGAWCWLLSPAALLLHLCLHVAHKAREAPLLWIWELDRIARRAAPPVDWPQFATLAEPVRPLVSAALAQARRTFDTPVPADVLSHLERPAAGAVHRLARLASGMLNDGGESLATFLALRGLRPRLRFAGALVFPSPHFMRLEYHLSRDRELPGAYARRAGRLAWEGLKGTARLVF